MSDGREKSWVLSSLLVTNSRFHAAAARASRSKVSATCKTASRAPGSVNCPAASLACSARSNHSKASFQIATIGSSRLHWKVGLLPLGPRSQLGCLTETRPQPVPRRPARSQPRARVRKARPPAAPLRASVLRPRPRVLIEIDRDGGYVVRRGRGILRMCKCPLASPLGSCLRSSLTYG
jgi:hypothetical protein